MKLIDRLRGSPVCFDVDTKKWDFDATPLIKDTHVFDITNIAAQLVDHVMDVPDKGRLPVFTDIGEALVKLEWTEYVNIVPPFGNCVFEYEAANLESTDIGNLQVGVHLQTLSPEVIAARWPEGGYSSVMATTVFFYTQGSSRETFGYVALDECGQVMKVELKGAPSSGADVSSSPNPPYWLPVTIALTALMLMGVTCVSATFSPEVVKSRQQKRWEERHPGRVQTPLARFYTLDINVPRQTDGAVGYGSGGWEQVWHEVRAPAALQVWEGCAREGLLQRQPVEGYRHEGLQGTDAGATSA